MVATPIGCDDEDVPLARFYHVWIFRGLFIYCVFYFT